MKTLRVACIFLILLAPGQLAGQENYPEPEAAPSGSSRGSDVWVPLASLATPGLGQWIHRDLVAGAAFAGTALAGYALAAAGDATGDSWDGLPRVARDQFAYQGAHLAATTGFVSAWDAFHRAVPVRKARGEYTFLEAPETVRDLVTAPFDTGFLRRWTTWMNLAVSAGVFAIVLNADDSPPPYYPFGLNDAAFAASLSMNAAAGEEALFRGFLLPLLQQKMGGRFWLANGTQSLVFTAAHIGNNPPPAFLVYLAAWTMWEGWLTRHNGYSIRESVFHHFWYDVAIVTMGLLHDEREIALRIVSPPIRF